MQEIKFIKRLHNFNPMNKRKYFWEEQFLKIRFMRRFVDEHKGKGRERQRDKGLPAPSGENDKGKSCKLQ